MCLTYGLGKVTTHSAAFMFMKTLHLHERTSAVISKFHFSNSFFDKMARWGGGDQKILRLDFIKMLISKFLCYYHINQIAFIFKKGAYTLTPRRSNSSIFNMCLLLPPTKKKKTKKKHPWHKHKKSHVMRKTTTLPRQTLSLP